MRHALAALVLAAGGCGLILDADPPDPRTGTRDAGVGPRPMDAARPESGTGDASPSADANLADGATADAALPCVPVPPTPVSVAAGGGRPAIAWSGTRFGVVWEDRRSSAGEPIAYFATVRPDGTVGREVPLAAEYAPEPDIAWGGSEFAAVWHEYRAETDGNPAVMFLGIDEAGTPLGAPRIVSAPDALAHDAAITTGAGEYGVAWYDDRGGAANIRFVRVDRSGVPLAAETTITTGGSAHDADVAWSGARYGIVWQDETSGSPMIQLAVVDPGMPGVRGIALVNEPASFTADVRPTIAFAADVFGIAWWDLRIDDGPVQVRFAAFDVDAIKQGGDVTLTMTGGDEVAIATMGDRFALAWEDDRDGAGGDVYLTALGPRGGRLAGDARVSDVAPSESDKPGVAWTGTGWGVVWEEGDADVGDALIYFALVCAPL